MRRIWLFLLTLMLLSTTALSVMALAQEEGAGTGNVPTWYVGDTWNYSESGTYQLINPSAAVTLNETLTYVVTAVSDTEYTVTKTSSAVTGSIRYSTLTFQLCNASDRGTLRVRRSDLRVIQEQRVINVGVRPIVGCINNAVIADITLKNLGIGPSLYDFPLADGNSFSFTPGIQATGSIQVHITGIPPVEQPIDAMPDTTVVTAVSADGSNFVIQSSLLTAGGEVPTITDTFDASVKTYNKQELRANIPDIANTNYTRTLTGANLVTPAATITLAIAGPGGDATAQIGDMITLSGTVTPAPPAGTAVTLRQPEFNANWAATTDGAGNYSTTVTVPSNFTDTVMRGDPTVVAKPGIIAAAGNAYTVATLTVFPAP